MDMSKYSDTIIEEIREHLNELNSNLLDFEKNKKDAALLNEIFRHAHTIKSLAGTMGHEKLLELMRELENELQVVRSTKMEITDEMMDILYDSSSLAEILLNEYTENKTEKTDISSLIKRIKDILPKEEDIKAIEDTEELNKHLKITPEENKKLIDAHHSKLQCKKIISKVNKDCRVKGAAIELLFQQLKSNGEIIKVVPDTKTISKSPGSPLFLFIYITKLSDKKIKQIIKDADDIEEPLITELEIDENGIKTNIEPEHAKKIPKKVIELEKSLKITQAENMMLVKAFKEKKQCKKIVSQIEESCKVKAAAVELLIQALSEIGEVIKCIPDQKEISKSKYGNWFLILLTTKEDDEKIHKIVEKTDDIKNTTIRNVKLNEKGILIDLKKEKSKISKAKKTIIAPTVQSSSIRVDISKLNKLMDLIGELAISKIMINQIATETKSEDLSLAISKLDKLVFELQDEIMQMRMVPVDQVFSRYPKLVRDLSRKQNKDIDFITKGMSIELDRTILDEINDPLVHLLRNAVDHGIETKEERKKKGKKPEGKLILNTMREKNNVVIEIEDDGEGIDPHKIIEKAKKKKIVNEKQLEGLSKKEIMDLIYLPGFSTAEEITDVSGRGVGLDVVKATVESYGGSISLQTDKDKGTKFSIRLPLTLAIVQSLLAMVGEEKFAIPLDNVREIANIKKADITTLKDHEVIVLGEKIIPIIDLHQRFDIEHTKNQSDLELAVVVVEKNNLIGGILVDSVLRQQEIIIKKLGKIVKNVKGFTGATILGDGKVILILDIDELLSNLYTAQRQKSKALRKEKKESG